MDQTAHDRISEALRDWVSIRENQARGDLRECVIGDSEAAGNL